VQQVGNEVVISTVQKVGIEVLMNEFRCKTLRHNTKNSPYTLNGLALETYEEYVIAQLLVAMGIRFFHHLKIEFPITPNSSQNLLWCPDFIFVEPFRWVGPECNGSVIIGIEAKKVHFTGKPMWKSRLLCDHYGVPVLIINGNHLPKYQEKGRLPLKDVA
jgi:hypothetical protein